MSNGHARKRKLLKQERQDYLSKKDALTYVRRSLLLKQEGRSYLRIQKNAIVRIFIMEYGVMSMPALVVNEKAVFMKKVLKPADVEKMLRGFGTSK